MRSVHTTEVKILPYRPDRLSLVNKIFIIWHKQTNKFFSCNWFVTFVLTDILLEKGDEPNLILPKFARTVYFFFLISSFALKEINIFR